MRSFAVFVSPLALTAALCAQEQYRDLDPGQQDKHLTRDTVDHWRIVAKAGEVFRVEVSSQDFDPVIQFVAASGDVLQPEVDDPGSTSRFLLQVERAGKYEIRVHGPGKRGGGNYHLRAERFFALPIDDDRTLQAHLDRDGTAHVRLRADKGEILIPVGSPVTELLDPKGNSLPSWCGSYAITETGDHYVSLRGTRSLPFALRVHAARQRNLTAEEVAGGVDRTESLGEREMDVWEFEGHAGDFLAVELQHQAPCKLRIVHLDDGDAGDQLQRQPELQPVPVHSKGSTQRQAVVLGRGGRFQVQILSDDLEPNDYRLHLGDPSVAIAVGRTLAGDLPVGGSAFYAFDAEPGQLLEVGVESHRFDPIFSVKRADGSDLVGDDDGGGDLSSRCAFLVTEGGRHLLHVACFGNGGGGAYQALVRRLEVPSIAVGESREGTFGGPGTAYWHLDATAGQVVFFSVRSKTMDMLVEVQDPRGVQLAADDDSGSGLDALLALRMPADGRYTIVVRSRHGNGTYRLRVIDPDQS